MDASYPLLCACERNATRVALRGRETTLTYAELERAVSGLTAALGALGIAGRRVGSLLFNEPETVALYMALARAGAISVPVNTRLTRDEQCFVFEDAGVSVLVVDDELLPHVQQLRTRLPAVERVITVGGRDGTTAVRELAMHEPVDPPTAGAGDEDAAATIMYTSGTTGFPKGVVRSHRANVWNAVNSALGSPRTPEDVELLNLPIFGIGFLHFAMPTLLGGGTLVLDRSFDAARTWQLLESRHVTRTFLAPTMMAAMLDCEGHESRDLRALEIIYTAYTFPERLRERALARFGDRFVAMYGLTEAQLTCARPGEFESKPSSVGRTMGAMRLRVIGADGTSAPVGASGEITLEGPAVMLGYHARPDETRTVLRGGWVRTGDLGRVDEDGDLHYVGRAKEMIKTGGFSVDPVEVENAILGLDAAREAAVVGVEDDRWGEMVIAFVAPHAGAEIEPADAIAACRSRIAGFKAPKRVFVVDELPKNATGKVERGVLRRWYTELTQMPKPSTNRKV